MPVYDDLTYIGPPRSYTGQDPKYGVTVHSTENTGASARDEANYARRRTDGTSSHFYVDGGGIVQSLSTDYGANHAGSGWPNNHCIAYEFCGTVRWNRSTWMDRIDWEAAAAQIARDCKRWGIPTKWLTVGELADRHRGLNTHDDCRRAFGGTSHTDPGPNFPKDHLLARVRAHMDGDDDMPTAKEIADEIMTYRIDKVDPDSGSSPDMYFQNYIRYLHKYAVDIRGDLHRDVMAELKAARKRDEAVLGAVQGLDTAAILARIDQRAAEDAQRDSELAVLVESGLSGRLDAEDVLRQLGAILTTATED